MRNFPTVFDERGFYNVVDGDFGGYIGKIKVVMEELSS
jgi:hypothetical protein